MQQPKSKPYDIFISHSSKDSKLAIALCHYMETRGLRCWIAPRDIQGGADYAEALIKAIKASTIMVVVFTASSNSSKAVRNEVERAFHHQLVIIPFRTQDIIPEQSFEFFLSATHWLDALEGEAENYFEPLYLNCASLLNKEPESMSKSYPVVNPKKNGKLIIAVISAIIIGLIIFFVVIKKQSAIAAVSNTRKDSMPKVNSDTVQKVDVAIKENDKTPAKSTKKIYESNIEKATAIIPTVDLSNFNGASYTQFSTNYTLKFSVLSKNKLEFSGSMCGYGVRGTLSYQGEIGFKVTSGNATGHIIFMDNNTKVSGSFFIKEFGSPCPVDMTKD